MIIWVFVKKVEAEQQNLSRFETVQFLFRLIYFENKKYLSGDQDIINDKI
jgi:hypothetical protein